MSSTKFLKVKKNNLVYYSLADEKRYNDISKNNLKQFQNDISQENKKILDDLKKIENVDCINNYTDNYLTTYEDIKKKKFKRSFSRTQQKKISDSTNTFVDVIKHNYKKSKGLNQRMITFVTLTIPEEQKHTDKKLVKTLIDFIDHIKKVKNTQIINKVDTKIELLRLENYVWRAETTERGNIHFHLLFDTYVNHVTLKRVWAGYLEKKLGYTNAESAANIHNLKSVKDVGGYITKYMTKEPLNDEFTKLLKERKISRNDLDNYDDNVKYRRPVLYQAWGSSKSLKKLSAPTFSGSEIRDFDELKSMCVEVVLNDDIKDYVKVYKGKIYDLLNNCTNFLKQKMKTKFKQLYQYLYEKTQDERDYLEELMWVARQKFNIVTTTQKHKEKYKNQCFIPELF